MTYIIFDTDYPKGCSRAVDLDFLLYESVKYSVLVDTIFYQVWACPMLSSGIILQSFYLWFEQSTTWFVAISNILQW